MAQDFVNASSMLFLKSSGPRDQVSYVFRPRIFQSYKDLFGQDEVAIIECTGRENFPLRLIQRKVSRANQEVEGSVQLTLTHSRLKLPNIVIQNVTLRLSRVSVLSLYHGLTFCPSNFRNFPLESQGMTCTAAEEIFPN